MADTILKVDRGVRGAAVPTAEWPAGLPVVTISPDAYAACGVATIALT